MTPPCQSFPAGELPLRAQVDVNGRRRKLNAPQKAIDLSACQLQQMQQYKCEVVEPRVRDSPVRCVAVDRFFRRCMDRKGPFSVETTAWEGKGECVRDKDDGKRVSWSTSWHDGDSKG